MCTEEAFVCTAGCTLASLCRDSIIILAPTEASSQIGVDRKLPIQTSTLHI